MCIIRNILKLLFPELYQLLPFPFDVCCDLKQIVRKVFATVSVTSKANNSNFIGFSSLRFYASDSGCGRFQDTRPH